MDYFGKMDVNTSQSHDEQGKLIVFFLLNFDIIVGAFLGYQSIVRFLFIEKFVSANVSMLRFFSITTDTA